MRPPADDAERLARLRLIRSDNVGPITFRELLKYFPDAREALEALPSLAAKGGGRKIRVFPKSRAEDEMARARELGVRHLHIGEPDYPAALAATEGAPPVLLVIGHAHLLARPAVGIVGARNASTNGRRLAREIAAGVAEAGIVVASGMARGIDAAAHQGALDGGTVAVLAGGPDVVYPEENRGLYDEIAARGAILAESPPGLVPQARHFPRRNRIISGLAYAVVVVEAAPRSGSLITARLALEQGREVFAVPGSPLDPRCRGANRLIRDGATLVEGAEDVIEAVGPMLRAPARETETPSYEAPPAPDIPDSLLARARPRIAASLSPTPVAVDEIVRQCQFSPAVVPTVLLELELAGRCERGPGNRVAAS